LDLFEILFTISVDDFWNDLAFYAEFLMLVEVMSLDAQNISVVLEFICHWLRVLLSLLINFLLSYLSQGFGREIKACRFSLACELQLLAKEHGVFK
jgi:hypothetical protein